MPRARRLSDLSGARQILATDAVVQQRASAPPGTRFHPLGSVPIRGREHGIPLFRIDWDEDASTDMMTLPAVDGRARTERAGMAAGAIELHYHHNARIFTGEQLPVHLGRAREAEFLVPDPRVSRLHARIDWHHHGFALVDLSSNGTCVRFQAVQAGLSLRRDECVLHDGGEIALGPDFSDWTVPTVRFTLKPR